MNVGSQWKDEGREGVPLTHPPSPSIIQGKVLLGMGSFRENRDQSDGSWLLAHHKSMGQGDIHRQGTPCAPARLTDLTQPSSTPWPCEV